MTYNGAPLKEGYVEAFGVDPQLRRRGIGTALRGLGDGPVGIDAQQAGRLEVGPAHEVETELADGRRFTLRPGMSYHVADGAEPHRSSTQVGAKLYVID